MLKSGWLLAGIVSLSACAAQMAELQQSIEAASAPAPATVDPQFTGVEPLDGIGECCTIEGLTQVTREIGGADPAVVNSKMYLEGGASILGYRGPVLVTHPLTLAVPYRMMVNTGGAPLRLAVRAHPGTTSHYEVWAGGTKLHSENVSGDRWVKRTIAVPAGMEEVEVRHINDSWYEKELLYWAELGTPRTLSVAPQAERRGAAAPQGSSVEALLAAAYPGATVMMDYGTGDFDADSNPDHLVRIDAPQASPLVVFWGAGGATELDPRSGGIENAEDLKIEERVAMDVIVAYYKGHKSDWVWDSDARWFVER